ncbi:phage tail spike protein [Clostridium sp. UBA7791]|uniref:phage tail spike protein n=1 Tax=Clostridium sp. UBA7791 TaxID=1946379 RepID=UPI003217833A
MSRNILISIFDKNTPKSKVLSSNGIAILDNICVDCITEEDLNGNYTLDATFLIDDDGLYKHIHEEAILKVRMDYGDEIFRIAKVNPNRRDINVFARQITIADSLDIFLEDVRPTNLNGQGAISYMLQNSNEYKTNKQYARDLEVFSDISKYSTAYYMNMNLYKALHDTDQSFENRWGNCEVQRRGYRININKKIGTNRGFQVRSRKNLVGFEYETNIDSVTTRIKPIGFNGITIVGFWDSPLINNYPKIKTKEIKYEDVKVRDENTREDEEGMIFETLELARNELVKRAIKEFNENHIDELQAQYRISFVQLEKTEEYKDYAILERCYLGDIVTVIEDKLNINITVRAIKKKYDVLRQMVTEIELSNSNLINKGVSIASIIKELEKIPNGDEILQQAKESATNMINSGLKNSYVIVRPNEILIMDTKDVNTATKVWRWNNGGLGFSSNGYKGTFGTAITADGAIVADFITTGVLNANLIKTGVLSSIDGSVSINLSNGAFSIGGRSGDVATHTGSYSEWKNTDGSITRCDASGFYNKVGTSKREYHHLSYNTTVLFPSYSGTGYSTKWVTLPAEFRGKNINATVSISEAMANDVPSGLGVIGSMGTYVQEIDKVGGRVLIYGFMSAYDVINKNWHNLNHKLIVKLTVIA